MPPPNEDLTSPNGLNYAVPYPFSTDAPSTTERELLLHVIEHCTFDWRRLGIANPHVVTFHWVNTPDGLDGLGGVKRTDNSYSAPSTAFVAGQGDLGVYAVRPSIGDDGLQPWANFQHHIYLLRNIDLAPGVGNPLSVGGPNVFRDTVIRCLGMMVTWCGAPSNPYARDRLARVFGWTGTAGAGQYAYLTSEGDGSANWWEQSGLGLDLGSTNNRDDIATATLPWAERISEHVAEAFKDRFLDPELREWTARTGAAPSGSCGWPLNHSGPDTIDDIFLDELGSYDWGGYPRDSADSGSEGGFGPEGDWMYGANVYCYARHYVQDGLTEESPEPILEISANSPMELAEADTPGGDEVYKYEFLNAPFESDNWFEESGVKHDGPRRFVEWLNRQFVAAHKPIDHEGAGYFTALISVELASGVIAEDPEWLDKIAGTQFTEPPFYFHAAPSTPAVAERPAYLRSRVLCNSRPIPPEEEVLAGKIAARPRGPGIVASRNRIL